MKFYLTILTLIFLVSPALSKAYHQDRIYTRAIITKIESKQVKTKENVDTVERLFYLKILDGKLAGETKTALFRGENDVPLDIQYKLGNTVFIGISKVGYTEDMIEYISMYDIDNTPGIIFLAAFLFIIIVAIGRIKGFLSLVALLITILLIFFVFVPLILKGYSPLPLAIAISIFSILITLPVIAGFNRKTLAAISGASLGVIISSVLALSFGYLMHLSGIVTNKMLTVFFASSVNINLRDLSLASMILAALGAVMDVAISIASSTAEIYQANPNISATKALKSVLRIGTDILGSMVNTLILAYVGSSLSLVILFTLRFEPGMPYWMIFNDNRILSEIVKSAVGSIGMFLTIPITAVIATRLYKHYHQKCQDSNTD